MLFSFFMLAAVPIEVQTQTTFHFEKRIFLDSSDAVCTSRQIAVSFNTSLDSSKFWRNINTICQLVEPHWHEYDCSLCLQKPIRNVIMKKSLSFVRRWNASNALDLDANLLFSHEYYSSLHETPQSICIVGRVVISSIISLLLINPSSKITYVSKADVTSNPQYDAMRAVQSYFAKFNLYGNSRTIQCDSLHIFGVANDYSGVKTIVQQFSSSRIRNIVWLRLHSEFKKFEKEIIPFVSPLSTRRFVVEFDSVGYWYAGKVRYGNEEESLEELEKSDITINCLYTPTYSVESGMQLDVYFGNIRNQNEIRRPIFCNKSIKKWFIFITYEIRSFTETAQAIADVLRRNGFTTIEVMGSFNRSRYLSVRNMYCDENIFQFVIGGHDPHIFAFNYALLVTENSWNPLTKIPHFGHVVKGAIVVLVYSYAHKSDLEGMGRDRGIFLMPMYSKNVQDDSQVRSVRLQENDGRNNIANDVIVMLSASDRRRAILTEFANRILGENITLIVSNLESVQLWNVDWADPKTREFLCMKSKIFINIHSHENSVLETHRINNLLSLGICIVSERSWMDPQLDADYEEAVYFVSSVDEIYETVSKLLGNEFLLRDCYKKSLEIYRQIMLDDEGILNAMEFAEKAIT